MKNNKTNQVYLSYKEENRGFVEALALRLQSDARLSFWFAPWHSIPGKPLQEQMENALLQADSCVIFLDQEQIEGWQNEQMRIAIQTRIEIDTSYRVIPVFLPQAASVIRKDLPAFLRRYEFVKFDSEEDNQAFTRLLAGILGIPPIQVNSYVQSRQASDKLTLAAGPTFEFGHALLIGIANYANVNHLPDAVLNDAKDLKFLLEHSAGYSEQKIISLINAQATKDNIRKNLSELASRVKSDDTVIIFFSGHGARESINNTRNYILPFDCDLDNINNTSISGGEFNFLLSNIHAGRMLVILDSCHSGGVGDPKGLSLHQIKAGLSDDYYEILAQGKGRVIISSSRSDEVSWALQGMNNSLMTHYLLEALRGQAKTLGDGYVRIFDIFRHVAINVPKKANQHPIFKASLMEEDFVIARIT